MIRIITESASDITQAQARAYGIDVLPLKIAFDDQVFLDDIDIDHKRFFEMLIETDIFPKTSLASPFEYMEAFEKYPDDEIICITISSKLSGCYQSAMIAKGDSDRIEVIDSENATIGQRLLIELALKLVAEGKSLKEIKETLERKKKDIVLVALLDTLEFLRKGGRISSATAMVGGLLSIKPVVGVRDGVIEQLGKARGSKSGRNLLMETVEKHGPVDFSLPIALAFSGFDETLLDKYVEDSRSLYEGKVDTLRRFTMGSAVGTHVGPGAIGVAFFAER